MVLRTWTNISISNWTFNTWLSSKLKRHCLNLFCSTTLMNLICQFNNQYTIQITKLNNLKPKQFITNHANDELKQMIYECIKLKLISRFYCEQFKCLKILVKETEIRLIWNQNFRIKRLLLQWRNSHIVIDAGSKKIKERRTPRFIEVSPFRRR